MTWKYYKTDDGKLLTWNNKLIREWDAGATYPTDGLVARWLFDDSLTSEINNITLSSRVAATYNTGKINKCVDGGWYLHKDNDPYLAPIFTGYNPYAVSFWVKTTDRNKAIITTLNGSFGMYGILMAVRPDGKFYVSRIRRGHLHNCITTTTTYGDGNWHHVVFSFDGSLLHLWVDRDDYNSVSSTMSIDQTYFRVGHLNSSGEGTTTYLNGSLDLLYIYDRSLSHEEVSQLYNNSNGI